MPAHPRRRVAGLAPALVASIALLLAGCTSAGVTPTLTAPPFSPAPVADPTTPASPSPAIFATVTDDEGTIVEIPMEPQRIVSLTPATTEILFALGAGPRVIATTDFDDYPPEAVELPDVASYQAVDVEKIVGLDADLVIAGGNFFNDPNAIAQLRGLGIPVVVTYAPDTEGVLADIELVGRSTGLTGPASSLVASMRQGFDQVGAAVAGLPRPRVFYELDATSDIYTAADDSFIAEMIVLAGGEPITTGSPTDFAISLEKLITADPEVIVLGDAAYGVTADAVAGRAGWGVMTAVRDGAIRPANDVIVTRPGPRLVEGLRELALAIHPGAAVPTPEVAAP
ncbi:MAG: ABC transporter substrate-binding protein [Chloroflexota bacterium]|nr:ABC transporter substrate-binding protein [Chloroflexota bacterium]